MQGFESRNIRVWFLLTFEGEILRSFNQIQEEYNLISIDFYRFLKLSYLMSPTEWSLLKSQPDLEMFFIKPTKEKIVIKYNLTT